MAAAAAFVVLRGGSPGGDGGPGGGDRPRSATAGPASGVRTVFPAAETEPFPEGSGDIADDSAIWFDADDPARSVVVADSKAEPGGIAVYDLSGALLQFLPGGQIGNVDLRDGVPVGGRDVVLVGANDRSDDTLAFWTLDPGTRRLTPLPGAGPATLRPNYGFCLYRSASGDLSAFVTERDGGGLEQYALTVTADGVDARRVRTLDVGSQSEGCVADDERGLLYVGEEDVAVWRYGAGPGDGDDRVAVGRVGDGHLVADVEGLALTTGPDGGGHLLVSSQGDSTIAVYDRAGDNAYVRSVTVAGAGGVDKVTTTDGVAADARDFGGAFAGGLLVVHDERNTGADMSNLKLVPLAGVTGDDPPAAP
ncbi:phytase [Kineosporia sp. R_H_3]|uniref:phytase n=1 Tax=Kineosporia sp. R_H_3 TaxID=1961848 RepID=UPI001304285C|nr:phytase [Kineosporia sp. R_H_3]